MKRTVFLIYGVITYTIFFVTFLYACGFVGNILVPISIDSPAKGPFGISLLINFVLLGIFAIQHSVMARPAFKRWWEKFISPVIERSTYVLFSSLALIALFIFWQPLGGMVWNITEPIGIIIMYALFAFGWLLVLIATFLINHFDLFGLRQVWVHFQGREYEPLNFKTPWLYQQVRHPLYLGWFFAFWATPVMTVTHLFFAIVTTIYIVIAVRFEEHDLIEALPEYANYRSQVPMFFPRLFGNRKIKQDAMKTK